DCQNRGQSQSRVCIQQSHLPTCPGSDRSSPKKCDLHPTAEAHTFLGWTYHFQGRLEDAIAECRRAIEIDPDFGNPYNDIGAYMIEQGNFDQAIPWLQQAIEAKRYEPRHFPHYNLGRAYLGKEMYSQAMRCFQEA